MAHAGIDPVELQPNADRLGDAPESESAVQGIPAAVCADAGGGEGGGRVLLDVEELRRLQMGVTLIVAGVKRADFDFGRHRRGALAGDGDFTAEGAQGAPHPADHEMAHREADRRMNWVDGPGSGWYFGGYDGVVR